ncbi:kinase-like protein [Hymenopellis radicata]|nr:kinase-like protein [Hymenopellis radicata]
MRSDLPQNRRAPVRIDAEDGPWSVSVAESPHDTRSYSLYIKTPTHNLTLTRLATEIVELDTKLRDNHPSVKVPALPLDANAVMSLPPKRKSTFLNTLSRLASPHGSKIRRNTTGEENKTRRSNGSISTAPSAFTSPLVSPSKDQTDPFQSFSPSAITATLPTTVNSTSLAAYLTTISNTPALRQARVWKRFVRVRTDDLESVRVERAIKRVRSDLAAHTGMNGKDREDLPPVVPEIPDKEPSVHEVATEEEKPSEVQKPTDEVSEEKQQVKIEDAPMKNGLLPADEEAVSPPSPAAEEDTPKTPIAEGLANRIHRSRSADPETSARLSRAFTSSSITQDGASSQTETGDESSATGGRRPKKKRSMSVALSKKSRKVVIDDFEMMRVLGKGCAGKVLLVRHKSTAELYALKAITKRHVLAHQELQHTLTEQAVLKRMAAESKDPFVVKLWWSFHDKENLFLVMDFHPGGDLATQLARWGRLGRDRARFYAAEIVEGVEGLHAVGVIYRDLKPENILIGGDGHIVLTDFGLSKEFPRGSSVVTAPSTPTGPRNGELNGTPVTPPWMKVEKGGELTAGWPGQPVGQTDSTATFCGTAEYLAPEVIQGLSYSYEVDWWSFGTMLFEMLTGITPFWAASHADMYVRVLQDELHFPDDRAIDQDTKSLLRGLLQRNPALRISEPRIKRHPYFSMIDWAHVYYKRYIPPYIPPTDPSNASDTQNFDETFLDMEPVLDEFEEDNEQTDTDQENNEHTDTDRTDGDDTNTTPSQSRSSSVAARPNQQTVTEEDAVDVFDGYSFKGRQSILLKDDDDDDEDESSEEETDEEEEEALALKGLASEPDTPTEASERPSSSEIDLAEPKTPEARPTILPSLPLDDAVLTPLPESPEPTSLDLPPEVAPEQLADKPPPVPPADTKPRWSRDLAEEARLAPAPKVPSKASNRLSRPVRREKSGVPALDKYLSDAGDDGITEHDDEDDDWDFVEAGDGEDRNGARGTTLFARGVVDRYKLAVFRKASTTMPRTPSMSSKAPSEVSPTSSPEQRRGRTHLTFRRNPRQFLKPKNPPPSSYSSKSSIAARSLSHSASARFSTMSSGSFLTTSPTTPATSGSTAVSHSLKSKPSAVSVGGTRSLSDQSDSLTTDVVTTSTSEAAKNSLPEGKKTKKLKKYKEGAEKVFSLFAPTQRAQPPLHTS